MTGTRARYATVIFDVDSTIATIEGIDWLAERRDADIARECADLTSRAMAGEFPIDTIYERRLEAIRPSADELRALAEAYRSTVVDGAPQLLAALHHADVVVHFVSGGLRDAILPVARDLGVAASHVHAVSLDADDTWRFTRLRGDQPLATQRGKALVISQLGLARPVVMIGDGSTDAVARGVTDAFIAFTGVARRENVVAVADAEARDYDTLHRLLFDTTV